MKKTQALAMHSLAQWEVGIKTLTFSYSVLGLPAGTRSGSNPKESHKSKRSIQSVSMSTTRGEKYRKVDPEGQDKKISTEVCFLAVLLPSSLTESNSVPKRMNENATFIPQEMPFV